MKPKSWASNELTFIETHMEGITNFIREVQKLADNCQHTLTLLEKRYNAADISASERKRKLKRQKEQRSKLCRKQKKLAARKTAEVVTLILKNLLMTTLIMTLIRTSFFLFICHVGNVI